MCGIAGLWATTGGSNLEPLVRQMCGSLAHRGPDGEGFWTDDATRLVLGHRRLAIVDLTTTGRQPMVSHCQRYVITYNGELYNTAELRRDLEQVGQVFIGTSDTEVLVNAISEWGLLAACQRIRGIFAFAVWDRKARSLSLVRDRVGVKPLFFSRGGSRLSFASEVRSISGLPGFDRALDESAVTSFLMNDHVQNPRTMFSNVTSVRPGEIVTFREDLSCIKELYWLINHDHLMTDGMATGDNNSILDHLHSLLRDAVKRQMLADVPVGAFLSGGIDSSLVTALMQECSTDSVKTFSIGFHHSIADEAPFAKIIASHLGTDHRELYVGESEILDTVPRITSIMDQPSSDISGIPMALLSQIASEDVSVSLSGDGGDELFFGYKRYIEALRIQELISLAPRELLSIWFHLLEAFGGAEIRTLGFVTPGRAARWAWHAARLTYYGKGDANDVYLHFISSPVGPRIRDSSKVVENERWAENKAKTRNFPELMMLHDFTGYLPDQILTKLDRTTMSCSLEGRVPLLDEKVVEFAWNLPMSMKLNKGSGKWALKALLARYVPTSFIDRPKAGFAPPLGEWLRGPLRDWAESLLSERAIKETGVLELKTSRSIWAAHLSGRVDASAQLWSMLSMQSWLKQYDA